MANAPMETIIENGRVIDPAAGLDGAFDIGISSGRITAVETSLKQNQALNRIDASGLLVIPGMIDTHAHVYQHVTGKFGLEADLVGVRSGVTTLIDQGGPSCMTIGGFRHFIAKRANSRVLAYISAYLVGGLEGHLYPELYGPGGVNVEHTVRVAKENPDLVKGVKAHAEIGGQSRWGLEVIKLGQEVAEGANLPLYIHLGQLWPTDDGSGYIPNAEELMEELIPVMKPGDILAHPFTRHPGGFVSANGDIHPILLEAVNERDILVDVGHGSHFSFAAARRIIEAGIFPDTLGADMHGYNVSVPNDDGDTAREANPFFGVAPFNLTIAMTELLHLGVSLDKIVAMVTSTPARVLGMRDEIGSLQPGMAADISVLKVETGRFRLSDNSGAIEICEQLLRPEFCLKSGVRHDADSVFIPEAYAA
ncbi:MAG: amidohydrolase/deacetylase family metallohydrolase [Rhodospirillaceae bacterium]|nr:amidohydrolase/deacetylase family metallohydrolase [Rhodospirillaceae bacterium]